MEERSNIVQLVTPVGDGYHVEADVILESAKGKLIDAVIIGRDQAGEFHLSHTSGEADTVYLLALAQHTILSGQDED